MESLLSVLRAPHVHVGDEGNVVAKVKAMAVDGCDKLQVVSDFDMTLTRYFVNGKRGFTSYGIIENGSHMPDEYRQKALEVRQKYAPVEVSNHISLEERLKAMEEWWEAAHNLLVKYKLRRDQIEDMVTEANVDFRIGCEALLSLLEEKRIPLTIFSAGLADTITVTLRQHSLMKGNVYIISNQIVYNDEDVACGFLQPVIHSLNKGKSTAQLSSKVMEEAKRRGNIILIGDSLGDPKMDSGLPLVKEILRIGFLNHNVEELLPVYLELYDIVVTEDGSLDTALAALTAVVGM